MHFAPRASACRTGDQAFVCGRDRFPRRSSQSWRPIASSAGAWGGLSRRTRPRSTSRDRGPTGQLVLQRGPAALERHSRCGRPESHGPRCRLPRPRGVERRSSAGVIPASGFREILGRADGGTGIGQGPASRGGGSRLAARRARLPPPRTSIRTPLSGWLVSMHGTCGGSPYSFAGGMGLPEGPSIPAISGRGGLRPFHRGGCPAAGASRQGSTAKGKPGAWSA